MKYLLLSLWFVFLPLISFGQKKDSLLAVMNSNAHDTAKVMAHISYAKQFSQVSLDTIVPIYREVLQRIDRSLNVHKSDNEVVFRLRSLRASVLNNIGTVFQFNGMYEKAIEYYSSALELERSLGNPMGTASTLNNLGQMQSNLENHELAVELWKEAYDIWLKNDFKIGIARCLNNFGYVERLNHNYDKAFDYYRQSLSLRMESGDKRGIAIGYNNIGWLHKHLGQYDSALFYYKKALDETQGNSSMLFEEVTFYSNIGGTYVKIGDLNKAEEYLKQSLSISADDPNIATDVYTYEHLYNMYLARKDYKNALDSYEMHVLLKDSLNNIKNQKAIIKNSIRDEFAKKEEIRIREAKIKELNQRRILDEKETERKRQVIVSISIGLILVLVVTFSILLYRRYLLTTRQKKVIESQRAEIQMDALRAQMNPHFIFNTLNSIKYQVVKNDKDQAADYLTKFAAVIRLILENSKKAVIPLHEEIDCLRQYVELEQVRTNYKFEFEITAEEECMDFVVPPLLLQPYVENAIWHGVVPMEGKGKISVLISGNDTHCIIEIKDNGVGREASTKNPGKPNHGTSLGTKITEERIHLFGDVFKLVTSVRTEDLDKKLRTGTNVIIEFNDSKD